MNKKDLRVALEKIEKCKQHIARERDTLRDIISEVKEIVEHSDSAVCDMENACDTLSQYL